MPQLRFEKDPLGVLASTKPLVANAQFVSIHETAIEALVPRIRERIQQGLDNIAPRVSLGSYAKDVQLLFFRNAVNFCYWAEKDVPKWHVAYPPGQNLDGEVAMVACFDRALAEGLPVLDASFMESLSDEQNAQFFRSSNASPMPLLAKRKEHLREAGRVLNAKYDGQFSNVIEAAKFDAIELVKLTYQDFSSFADIAEFEQKNIYFLKRAQFNASAIGGLGTKKLTNLDQLTAFADYKIPQMLRHFGIMSYADSLAKKLDSFTLIPTESREEFEIRSGTIWASELIRQKMPEYTTAEIDHALWLQSQNQIDIKPYHRTYSIYY